MPSDNQGPAPTGFAALLAIANGKAEGIRALSSEDIHKRLDNYDTIYPYSTGMFILIISLTAIVLVVLLLRCKFPVEIFVRKWKIDNLRASDLFLTQCLPIQSNYTLSMRFDPDTKCKSYIPVYIIVATVHILIDFAILAVPIFLVLRLQVPMRKKVAALGLSSIGFLAASCSVFRAAFAVLYSTSADFTFIASWIAYCSHFEICLAIIASSLPRLRRRFSSRASATMVVLSTNNTAPNRRDAYSPDKSPAAKHTSLQSQNFNKIPSTTSIMTVDTLSLAGKVAIVTGSGRENGIGAGVAVALARNGAAVTINYISDSVTARANALADKIRADGGQATVVQTTVVNNAGAGVFAPTLDYTPEDITKTFDVNVKGPIYMAQAVVPHMPHGGRIINISSTAAKLGLDDLPLYGASKAALDSLTFSWSKEWGRSRGITVNSLAPGPVATDIIPDELLEVATRAQRDITRAADRIGTPQDLGDAVLLLVSEKSRWITGQYISVSGGITGL
ncbi:hypothetical protein G7Z17_g238 [Cylindrodendrum hubeiense]|uniref:Rhodopsin domain-containing protein n=1 Tax=Cylindrodendrum hubeiense TaxID=595255 RepID=A0A9P5HN23_9HYPO|nr:hypothetical protein G7Z17_g238 [Cylindrodendrum hubeiense]